MDATSNPNPNEPNPPTLTDLIIILDEPTLPTKSQHVTIAKNHTNVILERMGPRPYGDISESVRRIQIIKTMTRINQQLLIITKRLLLRERE